jgi:hypothetical protein
MRARLLLAGILFGAASAALADGGRLRALEDAGDFRVAIFTSPEPLAEGEADVSFLVQERATNETVLDAEVTLSLAGPGGVASSVPAVRHARNRLFYGAAVNLGPGVWTATVRVRRGSAAGEARAAFEVEDGPARPLRAWPYLSIPPLAVALYAANRGLRRRERQRRPR